MSHVEPRRPTVWASAEWVAYFQENAANLRTIPWDRGAEATPEELAAIVPSLRAWQLGETSDGAHLISLAERYAAAQADPDFVAAIRLFIAEEQRHGETLGLFLDLAGVERAKADFGDSLFRVARAMLSRMEVWATVVVMVETHAMLYYNAIRRATGSTVLRTICEQILADEVPHLRFQCERLAILHRRRSAWRRAVTMMGHRVLFLTMTLAIWLGHRHALRAGGYGFGRFWRLAWGKMRVAWRTMAPAVYEWNEAPTPAFQRRFL